MQDKIIVIAAHFHPYQNGWTGFAVEMGVKGTHDTYNVVYNGECSNEYRATENRAKEDARKAIDQKAFIEKQKCSGVIEDVGLF